MRDNNQDAGRNNECEEQGNSDDADAGNRVDCRLHGSRWHYW
jgi:hypothetical protein